MNRIPVGREPVDLVSFANDSMLLVANNLPEMSSLAYPVACQLDIVDVNHKKVVKRLQLPNGSTDVKALATVKATMHMPSICWHATSSRPIRWIVDG